MLHDRRSNAYVSCVIGHFLKALDAPQSAAEFIHRQLMHNPQHD
jgi:hypothetical protein